MTDTASDVPPLLPLPLLPVSPPEERAARARNPVGAG